MQNDLGMALMYISHDLAVVGQVADEIMVMYLGMVMEHSTTDEIFDNPLHPYTIGIMALDPDDGRQTGTVEADQRLFTQPLCDISLDVLSSRGVNAVSQVM